MANVTVKDALDAAGKDRLYQLLPYIYRLRDAEQGEPLRALLQVVSEQVNLVEADIARMYDNWFIETCEDWVVPYLGDLIGYSQVTEASNLVMRRDLANTLGYRRRKGTLALLELLAMDTAQWPARAVEFFPRLAQNQHLTHQHARHLNRGQLVDLRQPRRLQWLNGPFDRHAHTADVRLINSPLASLRKPPQAWYNIANVALFVWRLRSYSVTQTPALPLDQRNCYSFSTLGNNAPLFSRWQPQEDPGEIAGRAHVPAPITRLEFSDDGGKHASPHYYGEGKSLAIWAPGWPTADSPQPIPIRHIIPANLSQWDAYKPPKDHVAVDPELGRILFPPRQLPRNGVRVSYHYGFSADMGGGEYLRRIDRPVSGEVYRVGNGQEYVSIKLALQAWKDKWALRDTKGEAQPVDSLIEITDSGLYEDAIHIDLPAGHHLQLAASSGARPVILLADRPDQLLVGGEAGSYFTMDGLLIAGRGLQIEGEVAGVIIRHSTLVPGWNLDPECEPEQLEEPSIDLVNTWPCLTVEYSILGSIQINNDEVHRDPLSIRISDSILDATGSDCEGPACEAIGGYGCSLAQAHLTLLRSTVFGRIDVHAVDLAENSILMGKLKVARRQHGCVRFCYVRPGSRTPRRFHCEPDLAQALAREQLRGQADTEPTEAELDAVAQAARERVKPQFTSQRYGNPGYCQLGAHCASEITGGASDQSEMGAFHHLYQPQRLANLRARLEEYIPARCDAAVQLIN
jgi:hypothetical protein